jgi:hypothetical protein
MSGNSNLADELRPIKMGWIWGITSVIVFVFWGIHAQSGVLQQLQITDNVNYFVAGYTLPLTVGFGVIAFLVLTGVAEKVHPYLSITGAAAILLAAGEGARAFGLGLLPEYREPIGSGPLVFFRVLQGYFSTYGWPLMICALVLGCVAAVQIERWIHSFER